MNKKDIEITPSVSEGQGSPRRDAEVLICKLNSNWRPQSIKIKKAGGQTNRNWIVDDGNKKYFVRIPWERTDIVDRKVESQNILSLSRNKKLKAILSKYILFIYNGRNILQSKSKKIFQAPDGTMICEYVPGKTFSLSLLKKKNYQKKLAEVFQIFHSSNVRFVNKYDVFRDEVEKYRSAAKKYPLYEIVRKEIVLKMENFEKEAEKMLDVVKNGVSTHNDFIFQNFLVGDNKKIYLLDFEYAGLNQKGGIIYDFGFLFADNLFRNQKITKELFEEFLSVADKIYNQNFNREKIYWASIAAVLVMFWWGLIRYFSVKNEKEKKYFKDYVLRRAEGIDYIFSFLQ